MINNRLVNISLIIPGTLTLLFVIFPGLDLAISSIFYTEETGFIGKGHIISLLFFRSVPIMTQLFVSGCSVYMLYILIKHRDVKALLRSSAFFLFISVAIGPGLITHSILKENFGRARPRDVIEFTGDKQFSRAVAISNQCITNCSFVSGHAAMAFYFTAIAYVVSAAYFNRVYTLGLLFGTCVGISRIIMGGHFASDITAAAFIVLLLNHIAYILWKRINLK